MKQIAAGAQSYSVEFTVANKPFDWLEISLFYDKCDGTKQSATFTVLKWPLQPYKMSR